MSDTSQSRSHLLLWLHTSNISLSLIMYTIIQESLRKSSVYVKIDSLIIKDLCNYISQCNHILTLSPETHPIIPHRERPVKTSETPSELDLTNS